MPAPPEHENKGLSWPNWPLKMADTSSSQAPKRRADTPCCAEIPGGDGRSQKALRQGQNKFKPRPRQQSFDLDDEIVLLGLGFVQSRARGDLPS